MEGENNKSESMGENGKLEGENSKSEGENDKLTNLPIPLRGRIVNQTISYFLLAEFAVFLPLLKRFN